MDNRFVTKSPKELTDSPAVEDAAAKKPTNWPTEVRTCEAAYVKKKGQHFS